MSEVLTIPAERFAGPPATRYVVPDSDVPAQSPNPHGRAGYPDGTVKSKAESLARLCRKMTPDVVELLHTIIKGEHPDANVSDQLKAAQLVLDRGYGRAVSVVEMSVTTQPRELKALTREELIRLANGEVLSLPVTVDGEVITVEQTVSD